MKKLIVLSLLIFGCCHQTLATTNYSFVAALSYLNAPAGSNSYGLGALVETPLLADSSLGISGLGIESGVVYFKRALHAGSSDLGFYSFHIPIVLKLHIDQNFFLGLGYSADLSTDNRSIFYGPKLSFGYLSPTSSGLLGLHFTDWSYELQYLNDQTQYGAFNTLLFLIGFRF